MYESSQMMTLNSNIFYLCESLLDSVTGIQLWSSLKTLQKTYGFVGCILKIKYTSLINAPKGIPLLITWIDSIYYTSVVPKENYVCYWMHHDTGHPENIITYPVRDIVFYALLKSAWAHSLAKPAST